LAALVDGTELATYERQRIASVKPVSNYRILLRGVKPGRSVDEVVRALTRYSRKSPEQLRTLLTSGKPMVAKRTGLAQQATQYKLLLDKLGCDCLIEAEITGPADSSRTTSVLVTDVTDSSYGVAPRTGVTYVQHTRLGELVENIERVFRPTMLLVLTILFVVIYFGWRQLS
jgi:hypothetical protein